MQLQIVAGNTERPPASDIQAANYIRFSVVTTCKTAVLYSTTCLSSENIDTRQNFDTYVAAQFSTFARATALFVCAEAVRTTYAGAVDALTVCAGCGCRHLSNICYSRIQTCSLSSSLYPENDISRDVGPAEGTAGRIPQIRS